jgi:hypothetical protein
MLLGLASLSARAFIQIVASDPLDGLMEERVCREIGELQWHTILTNG